MRYTSFANTRLRRRSVSVTVSSDEDEGRRNSLSSSADDLSAVRRRKTRRALNSRPRLREGRPHLHNQISRSLTAAEIRRGPRVTHDGGKRRGIILLSFSRQAGDERETSPASSPLSSFPLHIFLSLFLLSRVFFTLARSRRRRAYVH